MFVSILPFFEVSAWAHGSLQQVMKSWNRRKRDAWLWVSVCFALKYCVHAHGKRARGLQGDSVGWIAFFTTHYLNMDFSHPWVSVSVLVSIFQNFKSQDEFQSEFLCVTKVSVSISISWDFVGKLRQQFRDILTTCQLTDSQQTMGRPTYWSSTQGARVRRSRLFR